MTTTAERINALNERLISLMDDLRYADSDDAPYIAREIARLRAEINQLVSAS